MGLLKKRLEDVGKTIEKMMYQESSELSTTSETETPEGATEGVTPEQLEELESCVVENNMVKTAQNMLQKAVYDLDKAEAGNSIYAVKDCLDTVGEDSTPEIITMMISKVAKRDPEVLKKDGEERVTRIAQVMQNVANIRQQAVEEATNRELEISSSESQAEALYTQNVAELSQKCEEDIKRLREKLQSDIELRGKVRDEQLSDLKKQRENNEEAKAEAEALYKEVQSLGTSKIKEIEKYLSKINS